jgi:DNA (cytosine-5)-methyltransferase 1
MDFCAGIGGGRLGMEQAGFTAIAFSEINQEAEKAYRLLHECEEINFGDLTCANYNTLPNFDCMIAGFPCQTFSVVGKRAGLNDNRGQIIYSLIDILSKKNIPYFVLENVKGLKNHNGGQTLKIIITELNKAGYDVWCDDLNSLDYGVPQMRERIYFVGVESNLGKNIAKFKSPVKQPKPTLASYLIDDDAELLDPFNDATFIRYINNKYNFGKFEVSKILEEDYLVLDTRQSDMRVYREKVPTLRSGRHGILYVKNGKLHKLTGYEGLLLQGFSKKYADRVKGKLNNKELLFHAGNAMTVNVIHALSERLGEFIND